MLNRVKRDDKVYIFVFMSLNTGARRGGVLNIKVRDINFNSGFIGIKDFKTDSTYKTYIKKSLLDEIRAYIEKVNLGFDDFLVGLNKNTLYDRLNIVFEELFNSELDKNDRKNRVVIHTLRHTFASHLAISGTPIYTISKLLNHKNIEHTMRYAKLSPDAGKQFLEGLYE